MQKFIFSILILSNISSTLYCMQSFMSKMRCMRSAKTQSLSKTPYRFMLASSSLLRLHKRFATSHLHGTKEALEEMEKKAKNINQAALFKTIEARSQNSYNHYFARIKSKNSDYVHFCEVENRADILDVIEHVKQGNFPCGYHSHVTYEDEKSRGIIFDFGRFSKQRCPSKPPHGTIPYCITWHYGQNYVDFSKVKFQVRPA